MGSRPRESAKRVELWTVKSGLVGKTLRQSQQAFQVQPDLLVSSKLKKLGPLVLAANNKFSAPAPKIEITLAKENKQRNYNRDGLFIQNKEIVSVHVNHLTQKGRY